MARPIGEVVNRIAMRAHRLALLGEFIDTLSNDQERKRVVMALYEAKIIAPETAELLIEHFGVEAA